MLSEQTGRSKVSMTGDDGFTEVNTSADFIPPWGSKQWTGLVMM